ncbi:MAG: hypothetical protein NZ929_00365 [Aigarchaeota archaeon]|nr:hypothetical protein [Aigarchaeota archaeon]MDW7985890.1 D-aminoacyl-tRNA deacylase [Nitrososphaerota archaeon]
MKRVIAISKADPVSMKIAEILIESFGFKELDDSTCIRDDIELKFIEQKHIYAEKIGEKLNADLLIFPSSHKSERGIQAFLTHPVGNWGREALYGGLPRTLSMTSASMLKKSLQTLIDEVDRLRITGWDVRLEVTHHGPFTDVPSIFIEVGGGEGQIDRKELEVVASASIATAQVDFFDSKAAIGFGGGHYAPAFTRLVANDIYLIGHMCPKYALPVDGEMVRQAVEKTVEKPRIALIDWKGISSENRRYLIENLEKLDLEIVKI